MSLTVQKVFDRMLARGVAPNHYAFVALMTAYSDQGKPEEVLKLIEQMREHVRPLCCLIRPPPPVRLLSLTSAFYKFGSCGSHFVCESSAFYPEVLVGFYGRT